MKPAPASTKPTPSANPAGTLNPVIASAGGAGFTGGLGLAGVVWTIFAGVVWVGVELVTLGVGVGVGFEVVTLGVGVGVVLVAQGLLGLLG